MYRFLFRFVVMSLTILTANLLTNAISDYMVSYKNQYKPLIFTLLGMTIIIAVFYPLFVKLQDWVRTISVRVVKSGNSFAGKYIGLPLTFLGCLVILVYFYTKMWYHLDLIQIILHGNIRGYF